MIFPSVLFAYKNKICCPSEELMDEGADIVMFWLLSRLYHICLAPDDEKLSKIDWFDIYVLLRGEFIINVGNGAITNAERVVVWTVLPVINEW